MGELQITEPGKLLGAIDEYFTVSELEALCFSLRLGEYAGLSGSDKRSKISAILTICEKNGRLPDLKEYLQENRPHVDWTFYFSEGPRPTAALPAPVPAPINLWLFVGAGVALIVIVAGVFMALGKDNGDSSTPVVTVTAVSPLKDALVEFLVTTGLNPDQRVPAGQTTIVAPRDAVLIEVLIITDTLRPTPEPPEHYEYSYEALSGSIPENANGGQVSYVAPAAGSPDVITVKITNPSTNEEILRTLGIEVRAGE